MRTNNPWLRPIATIIACLALIGGPIYAAQAWTDTRNAEFEQLAANVGNDDFPGAYALTHGERPYRFPPVPAADLISQFDSLPNECSLQGPVDPDYPLATYCGEQDWGSPNDPLTIVVGDSHAEQTISFMRPIAEQTQTNMQAYLLGGCRFSTTLNGGEGYDEECDSFKRQALEEILRQEPDNVLLMVTAAHPETNQEYLIPGIEDTVRILTENEINVIAVRDNPRFVENIYNCAQTHEPESCAEPVEQKLAATNPAQELINSTPHVYGLDFTDFYCPDGMCQPVIGNVYVYIDNNHISKAYGSTLGDEAQRQLAEQGWTPQRL